MSSSSFPDLGGSGVIADTSVLINLDASGHAGAIIQATSGVLLTTKNAVEELLEGERRGYSTATELRTLQTRGVVKVVELGEAEESIYRTLIEGPAAQTLGDGEAATIAYAVHNDAVALIDERKAKRICRDRFNGTRVTTTTDMMLHSNVAQALGRSHVEAVHAALKYARMHVPPERVNDVVRLLGNDRSVECPSLPPKSIAQASS
ncbi:hypothetical protein ACFFUT_09230 [Pseudohalocynthiibacter aestuariivivens]|uniref:PIN domain-containing protein n=1 Tax=Pseudohalocynthiibacter aestuariivivens TaxID=1591409 RepID=A0ABV5JES5_9RHOB|nr:hypothetical protein [Pseudohalocynthiibacter aestuariivivens]MBS9718515.1 hypothetical protein [Pseudohalocynthiibacter aestuariivivens]